MCHVFSGAIKQFLSANPNIIVRHGEPNFFFKDSIYSKGLPYYRSLMPPSREDQITLEGSPAYMAVKEAPRRIRHAQPCAKLILTLVNPVDRLVSVFVHRMVHKNPKVYDHNRPNMTFEECFFNESGALLLPKMVTNGRYYVHLLRYWSFFPPKHLHVVDGERLKAAPWEELIKIEEFLGLPAFSNKGKFYFSKERGFYCHRSFGCLNSGKGRPHPKIDPEKRRILLEYFKPYNEKLFKLLNRTFDWSKWCKPRDFWHLVSQCMHYSQIMLTKNTWKMWFVSRHASVTVGTFLHFNYDFFRKYCSHL